MNRQEQIAKDMAALRLSGAASAERLPAAWDRAKDWREYVRAFPLQSVAAAALVGFTVVPKRKSENFSQPQRLEGRFKDSHDRQYESAQPSASDKGFWGSMVAPIRPWAAAFATQAIQRVLMNQFNVLSTRIFTDERQSDNENPDSSGLEHVAGSGRQNPSSAGGRNGHYSGQRRSDQ
jgi:hypothetical protein